MFYLNTDAECNMSLLPLPQVKGEEKKKSRFFFFSNSIHFTINAALSVSHTF